jgi:hypothetical protein
MKKHPKPSLKSQKYWKLDENCALLANRTTLRIQVYDTAPAELAGTAHGTRLGALSDMAEELTAGSVRGYANWNTTLVPPT